MQFFLKLIIQFLIKSLTRMESNQHPWIIWISNPKIHSPTCDRTIKSLYGESHLAIACSYYVSIQQVRTNLCQSRFTQIGVTDMII